jgi:hypothetical protein
VPGAQGAAGTPGARWWTTSAAPTTTLLPNASNGDFDLDTATGEYYELVSGSWVAQGNLTGPAGPTGPVDFYAPTGGYALGSSMAAVGSGTTATDAVGGADVVVTASGDMTATAAGVAECEVQINGSAVGNVIEAYVPNAEPVPFSLTVEAPGPSTAGSVDTGILYCANQGSAAVTVSDINMTETLRY